MTQVKAISKSLRDYPNIGATLEGRLHEVGVRSLKDLKKLGVVKAYKKLCQKAGKRLPVCYYLYSLEGALTSRDWRKLSQKEKNRLLDLVEKS